VQGQHRCCGHKSPHRVAYSFPSVNRQTVTTEKPLSYQWTSCIQRRSIDSIPLGFPGASDKAKGMPRLRPSR
jgi:hypothetical protein